MTPPLPWYRHFWPWFIVVLMGVSIAGSLVTVAIAYRLGDLEIPKASASPEHDSASTSAMKR